jgi:DNA repair ATPase RecN
VELRRQYGELKKQYDELKKRLYDDHDGPEFDEVRRRYEELKRLHDELPKPESHRNHEEPRSHQKDSTTPKIALHSPEPPRDDNVEQEDAHLASRLDRQEKELGLVRSFLEEDLKSIAHAQSLKMEESHLQTQKRLDEMREDIRSIITQTTVLSTQIRDKSPEPVHEGSMSKSESDPDETPTRIVASST